MKELWFKNILNLEKGIASWKDAGREVFTWEEWNKTWTDELRIITIDAKRFEFSPNEIRVKQWENVALQINDIDRDHWALIADMEVYYEANDNIILDTSKTWTYEFACATVCGGGHRDMKGIIIVE
jgi:phage host-nuclease inhibitor protein Gam